MWLLVTVPTVLLAEWIVPMSEPTRFEVVTQTPDGPVEHNSWVVSQYQYNLQDNPPEPSMGGVVKINPQKPAKPKPRVKQYKSGRTQNSQISEDKALQKAVKDDLAKRNIKSKGTK